MASWIERFTRHSTITPRQEEGLAPLDAEKHPHLPRATTEMAEKLGLPEPDLMVNQGEGSYLQYDRSAHAVIMSPTLFLEKTPQNIQKAGIAHELGHATQSRALKYAIVASSRAIGTTSQIAIAGLALNYATQFYSLLQQEVPKLSDMLHSTALSTTLVVASAGIARASYIMHSRRNEINADWVSTRLTSPEAVAESMDHLADMERKAAGGNLPDNSFTARLSRWLSRTHPETHLRKERVLKGQTSAIARLTAERVENEGKDSSPSR